MARQYIPPRSASRSARRFCPGQSAFNDSDWFRQDNDVRWQYGLPPKGNANFAWVQHFIHHLAPNGMTGFVLANGSMSSNQSGDCPARSASLKPKAKPQSLARQREIRKALIKADLVDCMVALPGQLFYSTQIPVCLWFIARNKSGQPSPAAACHLLPFGEGRGRRRLRDRRNLTTQRTLKLIAPPLPEQKAIAAVLGALDDKIELNRRMNATLEAMARALFQSWFVDFDPVRAKLDGRQPAGMDAATAALFPKHFDHKAEGVIPSGWNRKRWGDIATLEYGKSIRDYRESCGKYRVLGTNGPIGFHDEALSKSGGIIIGRKGAYRGAHYSPEPFFVIDTAFYLKSKAPFDLKWAYYELLRFDINNMDSGSAIPSTSRDDFYGIPVIVPPPEIQDAFGKIVGGWFATVFANDHQSRTLATLRDTLLPELLSGELKIQDLGTTPL